MLGDEQNRTLTQVGAGTPMGELLRRYWMPIAAVAELDDKATKPVRLLGEDLVLYRDQAGTYGLLDRHCAHRRADLSYGWVEDCGLRCHYHGWVWDHTGKCLQQPFEETANPEARFKDRVRIKAYPVEAKAGLLWAYLGPLPVPLVPTWEPFTWRNGFVQIVFSEVPCNWFQCQENSIDPVHFYRRVLEGQSESDELWTIGRTCLWPNCLFTGGHFEWRVPIDDESMLSVGWFFDRVPNEMEPFTQDRIPYWYSPINEARTGRWITTHVMNQDFVAWVGQGALADRTQEHLGESDRGVIIMRKRMLEQAELVAHGGEPMAVIRDAAQNACVRLPIIGREYFVSGYSQANSDKRRRRTPGLVQRNDFPFLTGQPEEIRQAFRRAMGLDVEAPRDVRSPG
jgi:5,5'-dehydrodivanillate O-demethylase